MQRRRDKLAQDQVLIKTRMGEPTLKIPPLLATPTTPRTHSQSAGHVSHKEDTDTRGNPSSEEVGGLP